MIPNTEQTGKTKQTDGKQTLHFDDPVASVSYMLTLQRLNKICTAVEESVKAGESIDIDKEFMPIRKSSELDYLKRNHSESYITIAEFINAFTKVFTDRQKELAKKLKPMATGAPINSIISVLDAGQDGEQGIKALPEKKAKISHTKYSVSRGSEFSGDSDKLTIRHDISKNRGYVSIQLPDAIVKNLTGWSVATKKVFTFILEKVNEQAYQDGQLTRDYIEFSAQELIDRGVYATRQSALKGLKIAANILTNIKMEGELTFKRNDTIKYSKAYGIAIVFPTFKNVRGHWQVRLNADADWRFVFQAFSILPTYYYSLPNRASELLYLIFSMARQNTESIKEHGYFNIGFKHIQLALHLPEADETKHTTQDIKNPILTAIDDIEKAHRTHFNNDEELLFISPEYEDSWPIAKFLSDGYLQVSMKGIFAQPFIDFQKDKIKGLARAKSRQQKALEPKNKEK